MTRIGPRICLKAQGPLCPNLSQKVQKEVSQMANCNLSRMILLGGLSVNLNHLIITNEKTANIVSKYHHQSSRTRLAEKLLNSPFGIGTPSGKSWICCCLLSCACVYYTPRLICLKDKSMCNNFALTRNSRINNWLGNQVIKNGHNMCIFTEIPVFNLEKKVLQLTYKDN